MLLSNEINLNGVMSWFLDLLVRIMRYTYDFMNNITFGGTSFLKVVIFLNVIIPFLLLVITIPRGANASYKEGRRIGKEDSKK